MTDLLHLITDNFFITDNKRLPKSKDLEKFCFWHINWHTAFPFWVVFFGAHLGSMICVSVIVSSCIICVYYVFWVVLCIWVHWVCFFVVLARICCVWILFVYFGVFWEYGLSKDWLVGGHLLARWDLAGWLGAGWLSLACALCALACQTIESIEKLQQHGQ